MKKLGRNALCSCGSGKKYKRCCQLTQTNTFIKIEVIDDTGTMLATALAHHNAGQLAQAEALYQRILAINPEQADALHFLGLIAYQAGNNRQAMQLIHQSIQLKPSCEAYSNLGLTLQAQGEYPAAIDNYHHALALNPNHAQTHNNLGSLFKQQGKLSDAVEHYQQAIRLKPDFALAYANLGVALKNQGKLADALVSFQHALALNPDDASVYYNQGNVLRAQKKFSAAIAGYRRALQLEPNYSDAQRLLLHTQQHILDWTDYEQNVANALRALQERKLGCTPLSCLSVTDSPAVQLQFAQIYVATQPPARPAPLWTGQRYAHDRIRIAYVSGDLRGHAVSILMAGVFEHHDHDRFEVFAIALRNAEDSPLGRRVKAAFPHFITVADKSDYDIAVLMRELEIDIAVDLMGFTEGSRTAIFAYRPAPVQVNYLGYPATMGVDYIDYILADDYLIPEQAQAFYSEKVVYLPDSFQANDDNRKTVERLLTRQEAGLPEQGFVFCAFNKSYKMSPTFFDSWLRILEHVPDSILWLVCDEVDGQANLRDRTIQYGIDPERLVFAERLPYPDHLNRFALADLFLDTLPFNGGTTVSDALWVGVPVLTCAGKSFAGRMAGSLLHAIGLPELITETVEDYELLAVKLATDPELINTLRQRLAQNRMLSSLFNTQVFCRQLESAYTTMWQRYQQGELPIGFTVPS